MGRSRWVMIWLCFALTALGYVDRANLAVAAPAIKHDLGLSDAALGLILGSFYWAYAGLQVPGGWLMDRFALRGGVAGAVLLWSAATAAAAGATGTASLFACRLLLGAGEGPIYPAATKLIGAWFAPGERGIAAAILQAGPRFGTLITLPLVAWLILHIGWRGAFLLTGFLGVGLALVWLLLYRRGPLETAAPGHAMPALARLIPALLRQRRFVGMVCGMFGYMFTAYFFVTWFPTYLVRARGFSLSELGWLGALPTLVTVFATLLGGVLCDGLLRAGCSLTVARKSVLAGGMVIGATIMFVPLLQGRAAMLALFCLSSAGLGASSAIEFAVLAEMSPTPQLAGTVAALANGIGNFSGVVTSGLTGLMLSATGGSFDGVLVILGVVALLSAASYWFGVGEIAPMRLPGLVPTGEA